MYKSVPEVEVEHRRIMDKIRILVKTLDILAAIFLLSLSLNSCSDFISLPLDYVTYGAPYVSIYITVRVILYAVITMKKDNRRDEELRGIADILKLEESWTEDKLKDFYEKYPLRAGPDLVKEWIIEGYSRGAECILIVSDSFDRHDYPVYVMPGDDIDDARERNTGDLVYIIREIWIR
jgi:hypothetical protein